MMQIHEPVYPLKKDIQGEFINVKYPPVPLVAAKVDGTTDDTTALNNILTFAQQNGYRSFFPSGTAIITSPLSVGTGQEVYGVGPDSIIQQNTDNVPVFYAGGERVWIHSLQITHKNFQASANTWGNGIHIQTLYESKIERILFNNNTNGIYCQYYTTNTGDTTGNYVYSTSFRDLRIEGYSNAAMYLVGYNNENTGCIFENIYTVNWINYGAQTKNTANYGFYFQNFSESFAAQLNVEGTVAQVALVINSCDGFKVDSLHIEQMTATTDYKAFVEVDNSNALIDVVSINYCQINVPNNFAFLNVNGNINVDFRLLLERNNTGPGAGVLRPVYSGAGTTGEVRLWSWIYKSGILNGAVLISSSQQQPVLTVYNGNQYYRMEDNMNVIYGTAVPTTGTWGVGDKVYHTAPVAGGNIGWVCVTAGTPGTWKTFGTIGT